MGRMLGHFVLACDRDDVGNGKMKLFIPGESKPRWDIPARGYGANGPGWWMPGGDTPPGRYRCGKIHLVPEDDPEYSMYGDYCVDLIDLENQETGIGRVGISIHAGRTLYTPTYGCVRVEANGLLRVVNTILWVRKQQSLRREWWDYDPDENYVDFTMKWVDQL